MNASRRSWHPLVKGENVKIFRCDYRLQTQNLLLAFKRDPRGQYNNVREKPTVILYTYYIINRLVPFVFLAFIVVVANPKTLLYTVANPARGLLNREMYTWYAIPVAYSFLYDVCMCCQHFHQSMDRRGVVASPARGHRKKIKGEKITFFLSSFAPANVVSRDRFGGPVPRQPAAYSPQSKLNVVLT